MADEKTKNANGNEKKKKKKYTDMTVVELEREKIKINAIKKEADNKLETINGLLLVKKEQAIKDQEIADKDAEIERLKAQLQQRVTHPSLQPQPQSKAEVQPEPAKPQTPTPTSTVVHKANQIGLKI
ncbi:MAG: hypothetical protein IKN62_05595 [Elusimicrobia bacterium]|nr:hypothetical protein [Elusimicrobiota bacterium]